jgi:succinyl-diaminopimelate desuccinylase
VQPQHAELFEKMDSWIQEHRERMTQDLVKLIGFQTVSGASDPEEQKLFQNDLSRAFLFLHGLAKEIGLTWRNFDGRLVTLEMPGAGPEVIGLPLHIDVVPAGEGWRFPAFGGMIEDGTLYARGVQDDKGPIIQMLYAVWALKQLGVPLRRSIRMIVASQEETGKWDDIEMYLEQEQAPDFSIVSDSDFPIVNGEKGMVDIQIDFKWGRQAASPGSADFVELVSGERSNVVPNRAEIVWSAQEGQAKDISATLTHSLEEYLKRRPKADTFPLQAEAGEAKEKKLRLTFLGKSSHASAPWDGHNAALDALGFLACVPGVPEAPARVARFLSESCQDCYGGGLRLAREHDFIGKTTISLDVLALRANSATATVNIRPTYGSTPDEVLQTVQSVVSAWAAQTGIETTVAFSGKPHAPLFVDPDKHPELMEALSTAFTQITGAPATRRSMGGTTFAKAFPNALSFGPVLKDEETHLAHQADECLKIDHLVRNVRIYALALVQLAT